MCVISRSGVPSSALLINLDAFCWARSRPPAATRGQRIALWLTDTALGPNRDLAAGVGSTKPFAEGYSWRGLSRSRSPGRTHAGAPVSTSLGESPLDWRTGVALGHLPRGGPFRWLRGGGRRAFVTDWSRTFASARCPVHGKCRSNHAHRAECQNGRGGLQYFVSTNVPRAEAGAAANFGKSSC